MREYPFEIIFGIFIIISTLASIYKNKMTQQIIIAITEHKTVGAFGMPLMSKWNKKITEPNINVNAI